MPALTLSDILSAQLNEFDSRVDDHEEQEILSMNARTYAISQKFVNLYMLCGHAN